MSRTTSESRRGGRWLSAREGGEHDRPRRRQPRECSLNSVPRLRYRHGTVHTIPRRCGVRGSSLRKRHGNGARGGSMAWRRFPVPLPGHGLIHTEIRWLAPPANFTGPSRGRKISYQSLKALGLVCGRPLASRSTRSVNNQKSSIVRMNSGGRSKGKISLNSGKNKRGRLECGIVSV